LIGRLSVEAHLMPLSWLDPHVSAFEDLVDGRAHNLNHVDVETARVQTSAQFHLQASAMGTAGA
jgi:hypothetical protein